MPISSMMLDSTLRLESNRQVSPHMWVERCIILEDPTIGINRPFEGIPVISGKDRQGITFDRAECGSDGARSRSQLSFL